MSSETDVWLPVVNMYKEYGLVRRFRRVVDGLWIFGPKNTPCGIFINKWDYQEYGADHIIKNYLMNCDDELIHIVEGD